MGPSATRSSVLNQYAQTLIRIKARQLTRRAGFSRSDQQDIEQELALHLLRQAERFSPQRASLTTFVVRVVDTSVAMILRHRQRLKRHPESGVDSLERTMVTRGGEKPKPLGETVSTDDLSRRTGSHRLDPSARHDMTEAIGSALGAMPPAVASVCRRLMHGSPAAVGRELGHSRHYMRRMMCEIRQHLEQAGLG